MKNNLLPFDLLGGFESYEFETDELIELINRIKELDDTEYEFVMQNTMRYKAK